MHEISIRLGEPGASAVSKQRYPQVIPLAEAHDVGRTYQQGANSVVALTHVTCTIMPGDRITIMGKSGSGKSTLMHLLAGLDTPTSGTLTWPALGPQATLRPAKVTIIFQSPSLLSPLSVIENVELPLVLMQNDAAHARQEAQNVLERMQLAPLADKLPEELSGGQAQQVALARALVCRPNLLLADEPTGQLDHTTAQRLFNVLRAALDGTSTALVVATHDRAIATHMHQVWQVDHGVLKGSIR